MGKITLQKFVEKYGQTKAAARLGLAQPNVRKALHSGRNIMVEEHADGSATATETKPFPSTLAQRGCQGGTP